MRARDSGGQRTITGDGRVTAKNLRIDVPLARLSIVYPPALETSFTVGAKEIVLGRDTSEGVPPLDEPTVSRRHLAIQLDDATHARFAADLGSRNGSWVDGRKIDGRAPLESGSVI